MRFKSTLKSVKDGEITVLAIIESLFAMTISIAIGLYFSTWYHLVISVTLAPFLLLKTEYSTSLGISFLDKSGNLLLYHLEKVSRKFKRDYDIYTYQNKLPYAFTILSILTLVSLGHYISIFFYAPLIRTIVIVIGVCKHPIISLKNIPQNWKRITLAIDIFYPPELILGYEEYGKSVLLKFSNLFNILTFHKHWKSFTIHDLFLYYFSYLSILQLIILYIPASIYRISLKATSLVYLPIVWIINRTFSEKLTFKLMLLSIREDELEKFKRYYSGIIFFLFYLIPLFVLQKWDEILIFFQNYLGKNIELINAYTFIVTFEIWHVARLLNFIATYILFFLSDKLLRLLEFDQIKSTNNAYITIRYILIFRSILGFYVMACTLYIIYSTIELPDIGGQWFPF